MSDQPKEMCQSTGCKNEARAALSITRPTRANLKTTLYYDNREAPAKAQRLCKGHAVATLAALANDLIDEDD